MRTPAPPRIFGIPASAAPVVAVLRRGPSDWYHVGRWDHRAGTYAVGAWIRANLYPQRADVSPDGRWLAYLTAKGPGAWAAGQTYVAVSRLPWVHALAAWSTCGTWSRGVHFVAPRRHALDPPDAGEFDPHVAGAGLAVNPVRAFAVEHRRGWSPAAGSPGPDPIGDAWDEQRAEHLVMEKAAPGDPATVLTVRGRYAAFRSGPYRDEPAIVVYSLVRDGHETLLDDVQWADWSADGRLLVATADGRLQVRAPSATAGAAEWEHSLAGVTPDPRPAPASARVWR